MKKEMVEENKFIFRRAQEFDRAQLEEIALESFPESERKPTEILLSELYECFAATLDGATVGFAAVIRVNGIVLLDYLAVKKKMRGKKIGEKIMRALLEIYRGEREFFLEIETLGLSIDAQENALRSRRKRFYLQYGFKECGLKVNLNGNDMTVLSLRKINFPQKDYESIYALTFKDYSSPRFKTKITEIYEPQD